MPTSLLRPPVPQTRPNGDPRCVVVDGHTLGCWIEPSPLFPGGQIEVLHASVLRGAVHLWTDGPILPPTDPARIRPATLADFTDFRVCPKGFLV